MPTKNLFNHEEAGTFKFSPTLWICNCGHPHYQYNDGGVFGTIICQCGHELTRTEYEEFITKWRISQMTKEKEFDHDGKADDGKIRMDLLLDMPRALREVARLLTYGLEDHEESSWLEVPEAEKRYKAAFMRHLVEGEINPIDPQFGLNHDVAVALNALFKLELRLRREETEEQKCEAYFNKIKPTICGHACVQCNHNTITTWYCPKCKDIRGTFLGEDDPTCAVCDVDLRLKRYCAVCGDIHD